MKGKTKFIKSGNILLGIITEIALTVFVMAVAAGICWLLIKGLT